MSKMTMLYEKNRVMDKYAEMMKESNPKFASLPEREVSGGNIKIMETGTTTGDSYVCKTQRAGLSEIIIGLGRGNITLWESGSVINWVARADGYPSKEQAITAAQAVYAAASAWNNALGGRVKFTYTDKFDDACFQVSYYGKDDGVLASSFFPEQWRTPLNDLYVYETQYNPDQIQYIANTMAHELGHILGLRHEFSQEGIPGWLPPEDNIGGVESVIYGTRNPKSVMAYYKGQQIQQSDEIDVCSAYDILTNGRVYVGQNTKLGTITKTVVRVQPDN
jgi:hypothetical protein